MLLRFRRAHAYALGTAFLVAGFWTGAEWSDNYLTQYGSFIASRGELALKFHLLVFILPATVLAAAAAAESPRLVRGALGWLDGLGQRSSSRWRLNVMLGLLVLVLAVGIRLGVLQNMPVTDDEHVYQFQAKLLASGRLYADSPPPVVRPFFNNQFIVNNGRWHGTYFVGHPAVLALAMQVGLMEWTGPVCAALTLLLGVGIARRIFGERTAALTGALLVLSPFFVFVSATQLSQPTSALFLTLFIYAALRIEATPRAAGWWALAAAALSAGVLTRPQSAVLLSLPFVGRLAFLTLRGRIRPGWGPPLLGLVIAGAGAATVLTINHALTGSIFRTGYHVYVAEGHRWMFPLGPYYTLREISQNLLQINFWLLGWPLSLLFVPFFRRDGRAWCLAAIPIVALVWYGLVAVPTVAMVGPVYYAETIVPLLALTASGFERAVELVRRTLGESRALAMVLLWPAPAVAAALLIFVPLQASSLSLMAEVERAPYALAEARGLRNAVVFVHSLPANHRAPRSWAYFHRNNSPDLSDSVLFVHDLGPERNRLLLEYLPGRTGYRMGMHEQELLLIPIER
jgi:Dolichyl-phosphate-mannose-protein mannosyltransferase